MQSNLERHPPSLSVFFATEMWERYGFYIVQSLLALYLAFHFHFHDTQIYTLVGSFTALTYLSPLVGGWIADNLLGQKRSILLGAVFLCCSYMALAMVDSANGLITILAGVAIGTGLLKPNISSLLGNEYPPDSPRRERGFMIFYIGLITGVILGTTIPSTIKEHFGWAAAFGSGAFGMALSFATFVIGIYRHKISDYHPSDFKSSNLVKAFVILFLLWLVFYYILHYPAIANIAFSCVVLLSFSYLIYDIKRESLVQSKQTIVIGILCIISVVFWAFYFQMFLSLTLLISRIVKPTLFGINFPPPYYVTIQSIGMIVFGYFISRNIKSLNLVQNTIRIGRKFVLAVFFITIAYAIIALICQSTAHTGKLLSPLYFIPAYLMISIGELFLSPVGLTAITLLASRKKVSTMMGVFFVSLGTGGFLAGKLASLTAVKPGEISILELKMSYAHGFTVIIYILLIMLLLCLCLNSIIKRILTK